jgi:hypothetical protein
VALPKPAPGLVIRYGYLWHSEYLQGRQEGRKDRPCSIIAALRSDESGATRVLVLPITHRPPEHPSLAVEIPAAVKRRLGLDDAQSWVALSEWNEFVWPGPDLRRAPNGDESTAAYGFLPPGLFSSIRDRFLALALSGAAKRTPRS